tara:strand:+ start:1201 stop:1914 length:714 start_codon:yes stop_codon:yes gene_type:complete
MHIGCIIQARLTSKRFPKKILKKIKNKSIVEIIHHRVSKIKKVDKIIFAIPKNKENIKLEKFLKNKKIEYIKGSENNVLDRYYKTAKKFKFDVIIRITSDCPLLDPFLCSKMLNIFLKNKYDYLSNILIRSYPVGLDCEIFTIKTLEKTFKNAKSKFDLEHVTPYMRSKKRFKIKNFYQNQKLEKQRWTLDYPLDLKFINLAFLKFGAFKEFKWYRLYKLFKKNSKNKGYINQQYIT